MPRWLTSCWFWLRSVFRRNSADQELDEELQFHLERQIQEEMARGVDAEEARYRALRSMGAITSNKEECRKIQPAHLFDDFLRDLRYGVRNLRRSPGFSALAILMLALGIGANTAIFSVVYSILLRPLPYAEPGQLMHLGIRWKNGYVNDTITPSLADAAIRSSRSFESYAVTFPSTGCNLYGGGRPEFVPNELVSAGFLHTLGVAPLKGRDFTDADATDGHSAILSYRLWRSHFGGDTGVVGRTIQCNGNDFTVIGVLPADFRFLGTADVWVPDRLAAHMRDEGMNYTVIGRLRAGVTPAAAAAELQTIFQQVQRENPKAFTSKSLGYGLTSLRDWTSQNLRTPIWLLFGAVVIVLLVACGNVAGLLLARSALRKREMSVRLALGASRWRIARQLLTETLMLTSISAILAVLVAWWSVDVLKAIIPAQAGILDFVDLDLTPISINAPVLWFTAAAGLCSAIVAGLVPALGAASADVYDTLKSGDRSSGGGRAQERSRKLLLGGEVALAVALLACAMLMIRSFAALQSVKLGFEPANLQVAQLSMSSKQYASSAAVWNFDQKVLEQLRSQPEVESAASVSSPPLSRGLNLGSPVIDGKECPGPEVNYRAVSPGFFRTMGIRILGGRDFAESDVAGSTAVVIVNQAAARLCWGNKNPVGTQFWTWVVSTKESPLEVVGVADDVREYSLDRPAPPVIYLPQAQATNELNDLFYQSFGLISAVVIRTRGNPDLGRAVRQVVESVDPAQPVVSVAAMSALIGESSALAHMLMLLMGTFAGLTLLLTGIGLYGLLSYHAAQRRREIGIRIALGASSGDVFRKIVGEAFTLLVVGGFAGLAIAFVSTRLLKSLIFGVTPTDPLSFLLTVTFLLAAAALASYVPARRATRVDPVEALRCE